jgi:hypothetical protein
VLIKEYEIIPEKFKYKLQYQKMKPEKKLNSCVLTNVVSVDFILDIMEKNKFKQLPLYQDTPSR